MIVKPLQTNSGDAIHRGFNNKNILIDTGISATFHSKSNGRNKDCELERSKLIGIEIMYGFQGDVIRPISTLLGGESFIVSLSLALNALNQLQSTGKMIGVISHMGKY